MTDPDTPVADEPRASDETPADERPEAVDAWNEVGAQLHDLGKSLADALRAVWCDEENRRRARQLREGLEAMARELGAAIKDSATREETRQIGTEAGDTARAVRDAGARTWQETLPHLREALRKADEGLQRLTKGERAGREEEPPSSGPAEDDRNG